MPLGQLPQKAMNCVSEVPTRSSDGSKVGKGGYRSARDGVLRLAQGGDAESWSELQRGPHQERRRREENYREMWALASG